MTRIHELQDLNRQLQFERDNATSKLSNLRPVAKPHESIHVAKELRLKNKALNKEVKRLAKQAATLDVKNNSFREAIVSLNQRCQELTRKLMKVEK